MDLNTLDGNSECVAHAGRKTGLPEYPFKFATAVDVNKCLKQIRLFSQLRNAQGRAAGFSPH